MIPRKCHIKRIYGKRAGVEDTSTWIDVLRIDELGTIENAGGQEKIIRLRWNDDPTVAGQDTTGTASRQTRTVQVQSGGGSVYFEVKAIDRLLTSDSGQRIFRIHKNTSENTARQVKRKRVYAIAVTLPASATWDEYITALEASGAPDTAQYVDVELIEAFSNKQMQEAAYQDDRHLLKLNSQLDELQTTSVATTAARLDPFQMIVNVRTGADVHFISLAFTAGPNTTSNVFFYAGGGFGTYISPIINDVALAHISSFSVDYHTDFVSIDGPGVANLNTSDFNAFKAAVSVSGLPSGSWTETGEWILQPIGAPGDAADEYGVTGPWYVSSGAAYRLPPDGSPTFRTPFGTSLTSYVETTAITYQTYNKPKISDYIYNIVPPATPPVANQLYCLVGAVDVATADLADLSGVSATWTSPSGVTYSFAPVAVKDRTILLKRTDLIAADGY